MPTSFFTPIWPGHRCSTPPGALSFPQVLKPQGLCKAQSRAPSIYTPPWHSWPGTHLPVTSAQEADKWSLLPEAQAPVPHRVPDISSWVRVGISTRCPKTHPGSHTPPAIVSACPVAQAKSHEVLFDSSLSLPRHIQSISKWSHLYFPNMSGLSLSTFTPPPHLSPQTGHNTAPRGLLKTGHILPLCSQPSSSFHLNVKLVLRRLITRLAKLRK